MKSIHLTSRHLLFFASVFLTSYLCVAQPGNSSIGIILVGSTPGDEQIKSMLTIATETKVDFIRWSLVLNPSRSNQNTFSLNIQFGEAKPNTLGFMEDGKKLSFEGEYNVTQNKDIINGEVFHLTSKTLPGEMSIIKLNDNLFHVLTPQHKLMVGNGGWSYTLNRKSPVAIGSVDLPVLTRLSQLPSDTAQEVIFEGRTPCLEFAQENKLTVAPDCFKLKWKLTLHKDPRTLLPSTYTIQRTDSRARDITGKWTIIRGTTSNPGTLIYRLDPDESQKAVSFLLGDENVAFVLDKDNHLYTGNEDFSYVLNRRAKD